MHSWWKKSEEIQLDSVCFFVDSHGDILTLLLILKYIGMESWSTNVEDAYFNAKINKKVYVNAGAEFNDLEGHILVIVNTLYGLFTWVSVGFLLIFFCVMDFFQSTSKADMRINKRSDRLENIWYPWSCHHCWWSLRNHIHCLNQYNFKLQKIGPFTFHLGMDVNCDTLWKYPKTYIETMVSSFKLFIANK